MQTLKNRYTDAEFVLKKAFIDNQSQCKKLGNFFLFSFFSDRQILQILKKKSVLPEIKLVWPYSNISFNKAIPNLKVSILLVHNL